MHNLNLTVRNIRQTQIAEHFYKITGLFKIVTVMKERLWNCTRQNESEEADSQVQSVFLDLILYWMGRNTIKDIIRIIDRFGIWTDKSTLPILNFPEFDNSSVYVRICFFLKSHIEVLRGKARMNLLSSGSEKHIMCVWVGEW